MDGRKNNGGHSTAGRAGRKPKDEENRIRDLMKPHSEEAIRCLSSIVKDTEQRASDRISASKIIIEYTYGKPKETVVQVNVDSKELTAEEAKMINDSLNESY